MKIINDQQVYELIGAMLPDTTAFLFGDASDPKGAMWLEEDKWAYFRLLDTSFELNEVMEWWIWCEGRRQKWHEFHLVPLSPEEFIYRTFSMVAAVSILNISTINGYWEIRVASQFKDNVGLVTMTEEEWDNINPNSQFDLVQLAQNLEFDIEWDETELEDE